MLLLVVDQLVDEHASHDDSEDVAKPWPQLLRHAAIPILDTLLDGISQAWVASLIELDFLNKAHKRFSQNSPVWVWFIGEEGVYPELPKTASGKVQKHILREWAKGLVGKRLGKVQV